MNKILRKLRNRNIITNIKEFVSVVFIVVLSVVLLSGFIINAVTLKNATSKYIEKTNLADIWIETDRVLAEDEEFFNSNDIEYEKRLKIETQAKLSNEKETNISKIYVSKGSISTPYIESGETSGGCYIDKNVADSKKIIIHSDSIMFDYQLDNGVVVKIEILIKGTMSFVEECYVQDYWPVFVDENVFLKSLRTAAVTAGVDEAEIPQTISYNQILIKTNDISETENLINDYYENSSSSLNRVYFKQDIESINKLETETKNAEKMVFILPMLFLLVSILIVMTAVHQIILHEQTLIGAMKSIGIPNKKIHSFYSFIGAYLFGIGTILGILISPLVIPNIMFYQYDLMYSIPEEYVKLTFPFWMILIMFTVMALLGYLVSTISSKNILNREPIECLKPKVNVNLKSRQKARLNKTPIAIKMAARNIKIKALRTFASIFGIAGGVALLLCGIGLNDSINYCSQYDINNNFSFDIIAQYENDNFLSKLNNINEITEYETFEKYILSAQNENQKINLNLYKFNLNSKFFTNKIENNNILISSSVAQNLSIGIGDKFKICYNSNKYELTVGEIIDTVYFNGVFTNFDIGNFENIEQKNVFIRSSGDIKAVAEKIEGFSGVNFVKTKQQYFEEIQNEFSLTSLMINGVVAFASILMILMVVNQLFLMLAQMNQSISVLKVLGINEWSIWLSILIEMIFVSLIGTAIGFFCAIPLLKLLLLSISIPTVNLVATIKFSSFIIVLTFSILLSVAVSLFSFIKIKKNNMVEVLKITE